MYKHFQKAIASQMSESESEGGEEGAGAGAEPLDVDVIDVTDQAAVYALVGGGAETLLASIGAPVPKAGGAEDWVLPGDRDGVATIMAGSGLAAPGYMLLLPMECAMACWELLASFAEFGGGGTSSYGAPAGWEVDGAPGSGASSIVPGPAWDESGEEGGGAGGMGAGGAVGALVEKTKLQVWSGSGCGLGSGSGRVRAGVEVRVEVRIQVCGGVVDCC